MEAAFPDVMTIGNDDNAENERFRLLTVPENTDRRGDSSTELARWRLDLRVATLTFCLVRWRDDRTSAADSERDGLAEILDLKECLPFLLIECLV